MINRRLIIASILALCGTASLADETGLASIHEWRYENGRTCMAGHIHDGSGSGASKTQAQNAAISSWTSFTAFEYGSDWARYNSAAGKSMKCKPAGSVWSCAVQARPCKLGRAVRQVGRKPKPIY